MKYSSPGVAIITTSGGAFVKVAQVNKGLLYKLVFTKGSLADTADLTITNRHGTTIFAQSNLTAGFEKYPRTLEHLNTDGTVLTTHDMILIDGPITVTIAQGGDTASGSLEFFIV